MSAREDEPVSRRPMGMSRIELQHSGPQLASDRRERHRGSGVATASGFHGVHRQGANGVDRDLVERNICNFHFS